MFAADKNSFAWKRFSKSGVRHLISDLSMNVYEFCYCLCCLWTIQISMKKIWIIPMTFTGLKKKNPNISRFSQATHVKKRVWCGRLYSTVVNYVIIRLSGQWKPFCSRLADPQANHFGGMGVTEREQGKRQQQFHMPLFLSPPESVQFELSCTHHLEHSVKKY